MDAIFHKILVVSRCVSDLSPLRAVEACRRFKGLISCKLDRSSEVAGSNANILDPLRVILYIRILAVSKVALSARQQLVLSVG